MTRSSGPAPTRLERLVALVERHARWAPLWAVVLGLPALTAPLFTDDVLHRLVLDGVDLGLSTRPWSLYDFIPRDEARVSELITVGRTPWWTDPRLALNFFRPLTSATIALDHAIAPSSAVVAHLHSYLWTALLVACVARLHRRLVPERAGLATMLYALSTALTFSAAWVAARHVLVGGVLVAVSLERWLAADDGGLHARRDRGLGTLAFAVGLFASEGTAAAPLVYVALALRTPTPLRTIAWRALPSGVVLAGYLVAYVARGQGARGSGGYLDPIGDPIGSLIEATQRLFAFVTDCYLGLPSDAAHGAPLPAYALVGLLLTLLLVRAALLAPPDERRRLLALMLAGFVAALPGTLGFYGGRVLIAAQTCTTAVVALSIDRVLRGAPEAPRRLALVLAVFLLGIAPVIRLAGGAGVAYMSHASRDAARRSWGVCPEDADHVILAASDPAVAVYMPVYWLADGAPHDIRGRFLTMAPLPLTLTRTGPRSIRLTPDRGRLFESDWERLYRRDVPDALDVALIGASARWRSAENAIDYEVTDPALWDASCFLRWNGDVLERVELPEPGGTLALPWAPGPMGM